MYKSVVKSIKTYMSETIMDILKPMQMGMATLWKTLATQEMKTEKKAKFKL